MEQVLGHTRLSEPWLWFQRVRYTAPYRHRAHSHAAWQLTASLEGEFRFHTRGKSIAILPGEWILIAPEIPHDAGSRSRRSLAMQIFFRRFPRELLPEYAERFDFRRDIFIRGMADRETLEKISRDLPEKCAETERAPRSNKIFYALEFMLAALSGAPEDDLPKTRRNRQIEQVMEYMEKHFAEPLGIADFAAMAGLSESRFEAVFRETAGCSPMKFFNAVRLGHAQSFLLDGHTVKESALLAGFSSAPYFCRCFRQSLGISPGEFQKNPFGGA